MHQRRESNCLAEIIKRFTNMNDPRELRNKRLNNEHKELMRLNGEIIEVNPIGNAPYEQYEITFKFRTITESGYSKKTVCTLTIPKNYPHGAPSMYAKKPYPDHPNWFGKGRWCYGSWNTEESLVNFVLRCARTLQHDPAIGGSNRKFWKENKRNHELVLNDDQVISALDALESIVIHEREKHQIDIKQKSEMPKIMLIKVNEQEAKDEGVNINKPTTDALKITILEAVEPIREELKMEEPEAAMPKITILNASKQETDDPTAEFEINEQYVDTLDTETEEPTATNELTITVIKRSGETR